VFVAEAIGARTDEMIARTDAKTGVSNAKALVNRAVRLPTPRERG
jgi:hypothetical protein